MPVIRTVAVALFAAAFLGACAREASRPEPTAVAPPAAIDATPAATTPTAVAGEQRYPDVLAVTLDQAADGTFTVAVTVSSPYDTPARYADAWRVLAPDGAVLAERELTHDHAAEQPFTRSLGGVRIPPDVPTITVQGRDLINGYGGHTVTVPVPHGEPAGAAPDVSSEAGAGEGEPPMRAGLTYQRRDSNRLVQGIGVRPAGPPLDISLAGAPQWVIAAPVEGGSSCAVAFVAMRYG